MLRKSIVLAACLWGLAAAPAAAVFPGANGSIAIYDTGSPIALSPLEWSPDGTRVAYQETQGGPLVSAPEFGGASTVVYDLAAHGYNRLHGFGWSADGTELVIAPYASSTTNNADLHVIAVDGSYDHRITDTPLVDERDPEWSPDGTRIAFSRSNRINTIRPDGTGRQELAFGHAPSWSPDQTRIAFAQLAQWHPDDETSADQIFLMDADGSDERMISPSGCEVFLPCSNATPIWSPDGTKIAFAALRPSCCEDNYTDIWVMSSDGTNQEFSSDGGFEAWVSDWRPQPLSYVRPKGTGRFQMPLVPAFRPCTAPNRVHGPPLAFGSCAPPQQRSTQLTVGTPDANGRPANASGYAWYDVVRGDPGTPADEADVPIWIQMRDVRSSADLSDYTGELRLVSGIRITDRDNAPYPGGRGAGTVQDAHLTAQVPCSATADAATGSVCALATSLDALMPGAIKEGRRAVWEIAGLQLDDAAGDPFLTAGIFVP